MPDRDERVDAALAGYLAACAACAPPQRAAFLARFPDLADSLAAFLDDHERRALRPAVENRSASAFRPATTTPASRYPEIVAEDLPGYAPELNPDELVWCWTKYGRLCNFAAANIQVLRQQVVAELEYLQQHAYALWDFINHTDLVFAA